MRNPTSAPTYSLKEFLFLKTSARVQKPVLVLLVSILIGLIACNTGAQSPATDPTLAAVPTLVKDSGATDSKNESGQDPSQASPELNDSIPNSTPVSEPTISTETELLTRSEEANEAWGNWLVIYEYTSPASENTASQGTMLLPLGERCFSYGHS